MYAYQFIVLILTFFPPKTRVENLKKFKSDDGDCPTLVCTDLAARGLDLDVDHVIMFDFPLNSVSIISMVSVGLSFGFPLSFFFGDYFFSILDLVLEPYFCFNF